MIDLGSADGERLLADALLRTPLLALDFDGTLAPLVDEPERATLHPRASALLRPLVVRMPVAIVSGRGLDDLRRRAGLDGVTLVGNHGNEWDRPTAAQAGQVDAQHAVCRAWAQALAGPLHDLGPGIAFEQKTVSLSVHYRLTPDPAVARVRLLALFSRLAPEPELIEGKFVFNLMAPGLVTKYEAVASLVERHRAGTAIFVGDDVTDERVFERAPPGWLTVRVWDDEVGAAGPGVGHPPSSARAGVDRVDGVLALLERIETLTRGRSTANL